MLETILTRRRINRASDQGLTYQRLTPYMQVTPSAVHTSLGSGCLTGQTGQFSISHDHVPGMRFASSPPLHSHLVDG